MEESFELKSFCEEMLRGMPGEYRAMPDLELYMDQVLDYLSRSRVSSREGDELTSAMVNNYIKDGLVPRAEGKKYSRKHLVRLAMIARLKQVLSVKDMASLLSAQKELSPEELYGHFTDRLENAFKGIDIERGEDGLALAAMELALSSYAQKVACEYLLDTLRAREDPEAAAKADKSEKIKSAAKAAGSKKPKN